MNILMLTIGFRPNIGGIETHFDDFLKASAKRGFNTTVLTYQPIASSVRGQSIEKEKHWTIYRLPIISGFFYHFVKRPILEFIYLVPGLFLATLILLITKKINVIHAHGLIAGFVGVFWGKLFGKRVIVLTHSMYNFPQAGLYRTFATYIFANADEVLCLSKQSVREIVSLGVPSKKVTNFTYWIDLKKFKPTDKKLAKKKLGWDKDLIVFFVGRLVEEKGVKELLMAAKGFKKNIRLFIAGTGPLEKEIKKRDLKNVKFIGRINNDDLPIYYNGADILIMPSMHEEGFGRVLLESIACETPVVAANRGAIPEAVDETVGMLIEITPQKIAETINHLYEHPDKIKSMAKHARAFVEKRYSEKNVEMILASFSS